MALRNSKAGKFATGSSLVVVQAAMATGARALGIWRGMLVAAAAVAARTPLIELDGEILLHIVSGGGFGSRTLSSVACTCIHLHDQAEVTGVECSGGRGVPDPPSPDPLRP
jgi:hypothetical protein